MTSRNRFITNDPGDLVSEMLEGYVAANSEVIALSDGLVVRAEPKRQGSVGLVVANGSGHEPAMIGWVGPGLLDVNVPGPIFSSPGPGRIVAGLRAADRGAGVLLLVSSHAGDVMNATLAIREAEVAGLHATMVILYDDVGSAPRERNSDRRGGAGLFFVWKMVGAFAEAGATLADCAAMAARVRDNTRSISAAIGTVINPISGERVGSTRDNQLSVGMGVHGEGGGIQDPGLTADRLSAEMVSRLIEDAELGPGNEVGLLVNNAGSFTLMELSILYRGARKKLEASGIRASRSWIGNYATTLDQAGFALAICALDRELVELYDAPARGGGFTRRAGPS
jgi:dihydroxyacetone kinase-like protein